MEELLKIMTDVGFKVIPLVEDVSEEYANKWSRTIDIREFIQSGLFIGKKL